MIQLAIIGLGAWGKRLVDSVHEKSDRVRFTRAVAPRPEKAADYAASRGLKLSVNAAEVFADPSIDGVVSCGPAHLHAEHSLAALEAGKPVLAVKPMALTAAEAQALGAAAQKKGLLLAMGYNRCFMPNVAALRDELRSGALGELLHAEGDFCVHRYFKIREGDWKADPLYAPPGSLSDHVLYLTIEALGHFAQVHAIARHGVSENRLADSTAVMAQTRNGATAFMAGIGTTADLFRFHLFGTKGWAEARGDCEFRLETANGRKIEAVFPKTDPERLEVEAFADALSGRAPFPVSLEDAIHGVAALEAIARSANTGRVVTIP